MDISTDIVGRARELDRVKKLISRSPGKTGVLYLGPAGCGKSTLLRWTEQYLKSQGYLCTTVRVHGVANLIPRFPLGQLLTRLATACLQRFGSTPPLLQRS